jgi:Flp pilus assembly pilin Flp
MITVIKEMITVIKSDFGDVLSLNHRNHKINLLKQNHCNQFIQWIRGQSVAEYALLISVIAAALLAMQVYMKRGIQAAVKYSTDQFGSQAEWIETDPDKIMQQNMTQQSVSDSTTRIQQEGLGDSSKTTFTFDDTSSSTGVSIYTQQQELSN